MSDETYAIAFSIRYKRPGCVLIQAAAGGTVPSKLFNDLFPSEVWIAGGEPECPHAFSACLRGHEDLPRNTRSAEEPQHHGS